MSTSKQDVVDALAAHPPDVLRGVLQAADISYRGATNSRDYAERIADSLWWHYTTPLGYLSGRTTLDDIVNHVAKRLGVDQSIADGDIWSQLQVMTAMLVAASGPVAFSDLDPKRQKRLSGSWIPVGMYGTGAMGSFGAGWVGKQILKIGVGPIGRLLPLVPYIGPWFLAIRKGGAIAAMLGGPVGVAMSILALNDAMGVNYRKLVPLLLGVGALGPGSVDAYEVNA